MGFRKLILLNLITLLVVYFVLLTLKQPQAVKKIEGRISTSYLASEPILFDNLKIRSLDLSKKTIPEATGLLEKYMGKQAFVNFPHRRFVISYEDIGVKFNTGVLKDYVDNCLPKFSGCSQEEPKQRLGDALVSLDQTKFNEFVNSLNESVKSLLLSPDLSFDEGNFKAHNPKAEIRIDSDALYSQLTPEKIFSEQEISISTVISNPDPERQKQLTKELVDKSTSYPLLIKYGRQPVDIKSAELAGFIRIKENDAESVAVIQKDSIGGYLNSLKEKYPTISVELEPEAAILAIEYALLFRVGGEDPKTAVILPLQGGPSTDGTLANKYLELNKTQQRLHAFENGELKKTYIVGTGLTWETPSGDFKILRKTPMTISYTGGWYMPYYMPIGTVYGYFFGFHEIPYRKNAQGQITSRDVNTMGSPATGGCIQLYRKDAIELFEWADIGMPVLIHD